MRLQITTLSILFSLLVQHHINAQGIDDAKIRLKAIHHLPASIEKDSALTYEYDYLAEAYSGQQDSAAVLYIDSLKQLNAVSTWKKTEGLYLRAQGKYHDRRGEFQQALEKYTQAIESLEKSGDQSEFVAYAYILKAFVLNNNGLAEDCKKTLEEIRPLAEKLSNKNYLAWIIDWYGDSYFYSSFGHQDFKKALGYYLQVEQLLPQVKSLMIKADNAHGLAGCYIRLGDQENAFKYRNLALDIAKANNLHSVIFAVYGDMADVYEGKGDFDEAIKYRLLSLDYAKQTHWIEMEARAERNAAYTYKAAGDFKNALVHFEQVKTIEDSLARFNVQSKYHELETKYESGKKDLEIQRLQARNLQLYLYITGALLAGGLLFLIYFQRTNKKLVGKNIELLKKNQEIQMALTEGQNIERKRMAIELHDNINAKIAAAKWVLETINTPDKTMEEKNVIDQLVDTMSDIYEDVRFISHNLVPKELETKNLSDIIRQLIQNLNQNQKISFQFGVEGKDDNLDVGLKLQCYAMIMELINNTIKHSGCQHAYIRMQFMPEELKIEVEDDGKGFDPESVATGVGLKNINARINSLRGKLVFPKITDQGSAIAIYIPLAGSMQPVLKKK
jgi:signal transduction histidine kinase